MRLSLAPLEGLTTGAYRGAHATVFGGADEYYTPFYAPSSIGLPKRDLDRITGDVCSENAPPTVVQLLGNRIPDLLLAASQLAARGVCRLNLNLGCPSGTVTGKGRGSGFLARPQELDRFLDGLYSALASTLPQISLSIKTRVGYSSEEEWPGLLEIYNRYPIPELIIHPRLRTDMYRGRPRLSAYRYATENAKMPLCYNGDIFTPADAERLLAEFPSTSHIMIGRGALADPAIFCRIRGLPIENMKESVRRFHDAVLEENLRRMQNPHHAVCRMADLWSYMVYLFFEEPHPFVRDIHHCVTVGEYRTRIATLFREHPLRAEIRYRPPQNKL